MGNNNTKVNLLVRRRKSSQPKTINVKNTPFTTFDKFISVNRL